MLGDHPEVSLMALKMVVRKIEELEVSPENVRREADKEDFERLKASILAVYQKFGRLVEPIVITPPNKVIMGSLRLTALKELVAEKKLEISELQCLEADDLNDRGKARLFSFIENVSPVSFSTSDRVRTVNQLIEEFGGINHGGLTKAAAFLGVHPSTISRWTMLERETPELAEEKGLGIKKLEILKDIVEHRPELKANQTTLVEAASQLPRGRLESIRAEAKTGFAIMPEMELDLSQTSRAHTIFIRDNVFLDLAKYSDNTKKTASEIIETALIEYKPFKDFRERRN